MAEKIFSGRTFKVDPPLATVAVRLQARTTRMLGPSFKKYDDMSQEAAASGMTEEKFGRMMAYCMIDFCERHEPEEVSAYISDVISMVKIQRPSGTYDFADLDGDFSQNMQDIIPVCRFALEVMLGDFFTGHVPSGARAKKATS